MKGLVSGDIHQNTLQHLSSNISPPLIVLRTPRAVIPGIALTFKFRSTEFAFELQVQVKIDIKVKVPVETRFGEYKWVRIDLNGWKENIPIYIVNAVP